MKFILNCIISSLLLMSTQTYALANISSVSIADDPLGFIVSKDNSRAYVTTGQCRLQPGGEIDVIDLKELKVIGRIKVPGCLSGELFLSNDEKKLYVDYDDTIAVIDLSTFEIIHKLEMPKNNHIEHHTVMSPDKTKLYYNIITLWDQSNYRNFLVLDTKNDTIIDSIPNTEATCVEGCFPLATITMSPDGNYIYEMPQPAYEKLQRLLSVDVHSKKSTLLGTLENRSLTNGLILSKDGNTFYVSTYEERSPDQLVSDWYIYAIDINTMKPKEIYHAEHAVRAIGLSEDKHQLFILDLREYHKKITIIDTITGTVINNMSMSNLVTSAQVSSNPNLPTLYFITMPGGGNGSFFNVMSF